MKFTRNTGHSSDANLPGLCELELFQVELTLFVKCAVREGPVVPSGDGALPRGGQRGLATSVDSKAVSRAEYCSALATAVQDSRCYGQGTIHSLYSLIDFRGVFEPDNNRIYTTAV